MALTSAPSTPERPILPQVRRAFTAPPKTFQRSRQEKRGQSEDGETLFAHEGVRVVSFSSAQPLQRRPSVVSNGSLSLETSAGDLPWASHTERTIATGPLRIYRVLGSVAFLNSGNILQPLLNKSQCWCVDGVSKFALRIRENNYYRIELPFITETDKAQVDVFTTILEQILQYEKTPCPFKRSFTVELPEAPETPVRLVPWRPKTNPVEHDAHSKGMDEAALPSSPGQRHKTAITQDLDDREVAEDLSLPKKVADFPSGSSDTSSLPESDHGGGRHPIKCLPAILTDIEPSNGDQASLAVRKRPRRDHRTQTAPITLTRPHRASTSSLTVPGLPHQDSASFSSSVESFHTTNSISCSRASSPPPLDCRSDHAADDETRVSVYTQPTITTNDTLSPLWDLSNTSPTSSSEDHNASRRVPEDDYVTSIGDEVKSLRLRRTLSKQRTASPLPSSINLCSPYSPTRSITSPSFTKALLQRSCAVLLGPPLRLMALMIQIAVRITRGTLQGSTFGYGDRGERIPCSWDFSSDSSEGVDDLSDEDEDDYGVKLGRTISGKEVRCGDSWELD